jgi:hypothetical protein
MASRAGDRWSECIVPAQNIIQRGTLRFKIGARKGGRRMGAGDRLHGKEHSQSLGRAARAGSQERTTDGHQRHSVAGGVRR